MFGTDIGTLAAIAGLLIVAGGVTGVLAGLFGVGGGAITVPLLFEVFGMLDVPEDVRMPLAVGTSLAIIIPTSLQSARGHYARGAVDMSVIRAWALPILLGVIVGAVIARFAAPAVFQTVFVVVGAFNAYKLAFGKASWKLGDSLPAQGVMRVYGAVIGVLSSLMGIGGGVLSNMILTLYGKDIRQSVATSSAVGVLISIPGAIGYIWAGWGRAGLPPLSLGFVSLLAFVLLVPTSVMTAKIGVRLAHSIPKRRLEIFFACFLALVAGRFLVRLLFGV